MTMHPSPIRIQLTPHSWVAHHPAWLPDADAALAALPGELTWTQEPLTMFGRPA